MPLASATPASSRSMTSAGNTTGSLATELVDGQALGQRRCDPRASLASGLLLS
jgi:hypothetical protein